MAGTIKLATGITHTNGNLSVPIAIKTAEIPQATQGAFQNVQVIGTTAETVSVGEIATLGVIVMENLDEDNYVDIGPDSSGMVDMIRILPGERYPWRAKPGITIKAKANTAPIRLLVTIYED